MIFLKKFFNKISQTVRFLLRRISISTVPRIYSTLEKKNLIVFLIELFYVLFDSLLKSILLQMFQEKRIFFIKNTMTVIF